MPKPLTKTASRKHRVGDYSGLSRSICRLAQATQHLARQAAQEYTPIVTTILRSECRDTHYIEQTLDGLLSFCFDPNVLQIYKKLCRYYYDINPTATASYVYAYREMWDSNYEPVEESNRSKHRKEAGIN